MAVDGEVIRRAFGPNRRNVVTAATVAALLVASHVLVPHWSTRYATYLIVFTIWMAWFLLTLYEVWIEA